MSPVDTFIFLGTGGALISVFGLVGFRILRFFDFDRSRLWGAIADWAAANEAASRYRTAVRLERPWREWHLREAQQPRQ